MLRAGRGERSWMTCAEAWTGLAMPAELDLAWLEAGSVAVELFVVSPALCLLAPRPFALALLEFSNFCFLLLRNTHKLIARKSCAPLLPHLPASLLTAILGWPLRYSTVFTLNFYWSLSVCNLQRVAHAYPLSASSPAPVQPHWLSLTRLIGNWFYAQLTHFLCVPSLSLAYTLPLLLLHCHPLGSDSSLIASLGTLKNRRKTLAVCIMIVS